LAQERNRLARELHDSVTQTIFSMTLTAKAARILLDRDSARVAPQLDQLQELAQGALTEMRTLIFQLRPTPAEETGLVASLPEHLVMLHSRTGLQVELRVEDEDRLSPAQSLLYWQALAYALWEQAIGVALMISLTGLFRQRMNTQGRLGKAMAAAAYTAYIIHPVVLVGLGLALQPLSLYPLLKFAFVAALAVPLCFLIANYLRRLPFARDIL
jgi:hypothetical protein